MFYVVGTVCFDLLRFVSRGDVNRQALIPRGHDWNMNHDSHVQSYWFLWQSILSILPRLLLFLTNLHLTTHNHNVGHSNTTTVPACAVFSLDRAAPARQASSESIRKCPKALDVRLKLADDSAANPYWGLS